MSGMYIQFDTQEAFEAWHAQVNAALGYPNAATCTVGYTQALPGTDGMLYAPLDATCPAELLDGEDTLDGGSVELVEG